MGRARARVRRDDPRAARARAGRPRRRARLQRRLPAAALRGHGSPDPRHRSGRERRRGCRGARRPDARRVLRTRDCARRLVDEGKRASLIVGNNVLAQVPDLNDFVAGVADPAPRRAARRRSSSRTSSGCSTASSTTRSTTSTSRTSRSRRSSRSCARTASTSTTSRSSRRTAARCASTPSTRGGPHAVERRPSRRCSSARSDEGLRSPERYARFAEDVKESKRALLELLIDLRRDGQAGRRLRRARARATRSSTTAGSAPTSSTTRSTATRTSTGCFTPGTHIPIHPPEQHRRDAARLHRRPAVEPRSTRSRRSSRTCAEWGAKLVVPIPLRDGRSSPASGAAAASRRQQDERREGRDLLRRSGRPHGRGDPADPEADDHRSATQPILWHIMKWYASWGHTDFILCLGYRAEIVKEYFLDYNEALANDFVLSTAATRSSCSAATSTTGGSRSSTPGRSDDRRAAAAARAHLGDDEYFLATYGDGLTDAPLDRHDRRARSDAGRPGSSCPSARARATTSSTPTTTGVVRVDRADGRRPTSGSTAGSSSSGARSSTTSPGEELVDEPFARLDRARRADRVPLRRLLGPMDTIKDKQDLDALVESGARSLARAPRPRRVARRRCSALTLAAARAADRRVLALGCHADDIEIGCGGTLLALTARRPGLHVTWVVLAARRSARRGGASERRRRSSADAASADVRRARASATASCRTSAARSRRSSRR